MSRNDLRMCPTCGRPLDEHDRHVRFRLPDPVLELPEQERTSGTWMSDEDADASVMMQVPGASPFCRCLLPVQLDGGYVVHFGVWVAIHPDDLQRAFSVWWTEEYEVLELNGYLANSLPVWDCLGAPVRAIVTNPDHTPYVVESADETVAQVLTRTWPHQQVLHSLPS